MSTVLKRQNFLSFSPMIRFYDLNSFILLSLRFLFLFKFTLDFFYVVLGNIYKACNTNVCRMSKQSICMVHVWVQPPQMVE